MNSNHWVTRDDLRGVAIRQKVIVLCILVYLIAFVVLIALAAQDADLQEPILLVIVVGMALASLVATVFGFLLATEVHGVGIGVVMGLLTLVPLIGLIVLLIINSKATNVLREHGIHVGLLGARTSDFD